MAAYGDEPTDREYALSGYSTYIFTKYSLPTTTIKSWACYSRVFAAAKLKIFRDDGTNFIFVGESPEVNLTPGLNWGLPANITVQSGDLVGFHAMGADWLAVARSGGTKYTLYYNIHGDISSNTPKSQWNIDDPPANGFAFVSLQVYTGVHVKLAGNDANDGSSWSNAKRNVREGLNAVTRYESLHLGFEDYRTQPGIKFTESILLKCETVGGSGGIGTTILPANNWAEGGSYGGDTIIDRNLTSEDTFTEFRYITLPIARAQRFTPSSRYLEKIKLKLKRFLDADLYVELRQDSGGAPLGTPQSATGKIASVVVPYSSISTLALSEITITFNQDLGSTNPVWIVVCLNAYDPNNAGIDTFYWISGDTTGTTTEYFGYKIGNGNWLVTITSPIYNLYFKTYRGI